LQEDGSVFPRKGKGGREEGCEGGPAYVFSQHHLSKCDNLSQQYNPTKFKVTTAENTRTHFEALSAGLLNERLQQWFAAQTLRSERDGEVPGHSATTCFPFE
jgi:hypothetical protein